MTAVAEDHRTDGPATTAPRWRQVPTVRRTSGQSWTTVPLALWIALVGPYAQARFWPPYNAWRVTALGAVGTLMMMALPRRWWLARLVVAAGVGTAVLLPQGRVLAVWLVGGMLLGVWVAQGRPPVPFLPRPGPGAAAPVAVLCGVAAWQGSQIGSPVRYVVPFALACAVPLVARLGGGLLERVGARVGHAVGVAVAAVAFTVLGLLTVVVPWAAQRAVRRDPLRPRHGWNRREQLDPTPRRPWAPSPYHRVRTVLPLAAVTAIVLLAGGAFLVQRALTASPVAKEVDEFLRAPGPDPTPPGAWYPAYREDVAWALSERTGLAPFETERLLDVQTRTVNISDRHRVSWTPPAGRSRRLRVWLYGGNAAFGFEQRDDHTIASELARAASAAGLTVEVSNRGVPGQLHWRASQRFAQDLAGLELTKEPRPDLVLFYDGFEEVSAAQQLVDRGLGDVRAPYEPFAEQTFDRVVNRGEGRTAPPAVVTYDGWPTVPGPAARSVGELAVRRYDRARRSTADRARLAGVPVVFVWQAARTTGPDRGQVGTDMATASADLAPEITDLTHVLDAHAEDFVDDAHHDEEGARRVAEELLRRVRPQLEQLARGRG